MKPPRAGSSAGCMISDVAVVGPGRIGRQIALALALGGCRVRLVDVKARGEEDAGRTFADARREIARDLRLMAEEDVIDEATAAAAAARIDEQRGVTDGLLECDLIQEALPESVEIKREFLRRLDGRVREGAIIASTSSTISPSHMADAVEGPERFLVAHWLNPAHIIPLVELVPSPLTSRATVERALAFLEGLGKVPVRCADSPGFIGPRLQVLLMNEAARLVEEGVATPRDVDRAFRAGMGFRYASMGIFEFIDWGGVDILQRAGRYLTGALKDPRFSPPQSVEDKVERNELGTKTGRGFYDYPGEIRERFETEKLRMLLRQLKRQQA